MSEQVTLPNGEEAEILWAESILLRSIAQDTNIDMKGGEAPAMYMDKFSRIQPVYVVGALGGIFNSSSSSSVVNRSSATNVGKVCAPLTWTFGDWLAVPQGATRVTIMVKPTNVGAAAGVCRFGVDASDDGVTSFMNGLTIYMPSMWAGMEENTNTPPVLNVPYYLNNADAIQGAAGNPTPILAGYASLPPYVRVALWNADPAVSVTFNFYIQVS